MKRTLLALLPLALCGNLAFAQLPFGDPSGEASYGYVLQGITSELVVNDITGFGSGPASPSGWNVVNSVESFANPSGGNVQVSVFPLPWVSASATSVAPTPPTGVVTPGTPVTPTTASNYTWNGIGLSYFIKANAGLGATGPLTVFFSGTDIVSGATGGLDGFTYAEASICAVSCISGPIYDYVDSCAQQSACPAGVSNLFTGSVDVSPGETLVATLNAYAYSENGGQRGFAYIDPYFYLSPAEIAAGDTLGFSASVGNAPPAPVPLPATDALLLGGLGLLAIAVCRRNPALGTCRN